MEPTPANMKAAHRLMAQVQAAIAAGVYEPAMFFPKPGQEAKTSFRDFGDQWLETLTAERSTRRSYKTALNATWYPAFGDKPLTQIRHSDIAKAIAAKVKAGATGKTVNNHLVALRGVLEMAKADGVIEASPAAAIGNLPHQAAQPDPLDHDEMALVLARMAQRFDPQVSNYFTFSFNTGMRPSEVIALRWVNIDFRRKRALVDAARVDWEAKGTKTGKVREINLNEAAMAALTSQKDYTFLAGEEVFHNPNTGKPWADEQVQRRRYWSPTLKALGIRHRDAYQTRHTYASLLLTGGSNPAWIAKQLGHADITTTLRVYARWIESADNGAEAAKANAILSNNRPRQRNES